MLQIALQPQEYFTIGDDAVVVQLARISGGRAYLRIEADRTVPIVRGTVLEREGHPRPDCLRPSGGAEPV